MGISMALVVLHYLAIDDTCECIESIKKNVGISDYKIIVVDNASPDHSYEILDEKYSKDENVIMIKNEKNLGFANGNNVGFHYAKYDLQAKYIVLLNNDVCLFQPDFYSKVVNEYSSHKFAVMGPMIITKDGSCKSNPAGYKVWNRNDILKEIRNQERRLLFVKYNIDRSIDFIKRSIKNLLGNNRKSNSVDYYKPMDNVQLHGSFLIFSQDYISVFDGLDSSTFMYFEEEILFLHISKRGMISRYTPTIVVYHKEDAATNLTLAKPRQKKIFTIENNIKSMKIYLKILESYDGGNI